jgi:hypothetical protein
MSNPGQSEVEKFLGEHQLAQFAQKCAEENVTTVATLACLTEEEKKELGMRIGDRASLRAALASIKVPEAGLFGSPLLSSPLLSSPLLSSPRHLQLIILLFSANSKLFDAGTQIALESINKKIAKHDQDIEIQHKNFLKIRSTSRQLF